MRIGIITAMPEETGAVVRALGHTATIHSDGLKILKGQFGAHEILLAEAGMGYRNATTAAERLVQGADPELIISAGFCGGIARELVVGDLVVAAGLTVISENGLEGVSAEFDPIANVCITRLRNQGKRVFEGLFASTSVIMQKSKVAELLPDNVPFPVVEMESAAIARVATVHGIPFVGLRTVSDPYDEELGFSLEEFCDEQMRIRLPRVLRTIARKPCIIPQLIRLARNSRVAAAHLSAAIECLCSCMQVTTGR